MAMERTEAYDLSLFETRPVTGTAVPKPKQDVPVRHDNVIHLPEPEPHRHARHRRSPMRTLGFFTALLSMLGIVMLMIYNQVQLNELTTNITQAEKALDEQQSIYVQLQMTAQDGKSMSDVEKYAEEELGMKKINEGQITYITLNDSDKGEVLHDAGQGSWWDQIVSFLSGLLS